MGYELGEKRNMDMNKKWEDHANFLGQMAGHVAWLMRAESAERVDAIEDYTRWLSEQCFKHAAKHCANKTVPTVDEQPIDPGIVGRKEWETVMSSECSGNRGLSITASQEDVSEMWRDNERFCECGP